MEHLYLDAASTEPVGGNVISVMMPFLTEADNLAIKGIAMARIRLLCEAYGEQVRPRVIVSSIEHPAVLESVRWMERWFGCEVVEIPVDHQVHIDLDALSLSGHKFGTPKGLGALLLRSRVPVEPLMSGGGQERSLRSGTQNGGFPGSSDRRGAACGTQSTAYGGFTTTASRTCVVRFPGTFRRSFAG